MNTRRVATCGVYFILCVANATSYFGSSHDVRYRIQKHFEALRSTRHDNAHLQRAYTKYGARSFIAGLLEPVSEKSDLLAREQLWLDSGLSMFNLARVAGSPMAGKKHTPEAIAKIAAASKGRKPTAEAVAKLVAASKMRPPRYGADNYFFGRKHTPESRAKMSASGRKWKRKPFTAEHRANLGAARRRTIARKVADTSSS